MGDRKNMKAAGQIVAVIVSKVKITAQRWTIASCIHWPHIHHKYRDDIEYSITRQRSVAH
jgi:hypothetical protein